MKSNSFAIANKNLLSLCRWLAQVPLAGQESRERTRFIEVCSPRISEMEKVRVDMAKELAEKDENGQPKLVEEDGATKYDLTEDSIKKLNEDYALYLNEDFVLDILDGNIAKVKTARNIVLNTKQEFSGQVAAEYDAWCLAFEKVELD